MADAEKTCPRCREKVKLLASLCKHCGYEFSASQMEAARKQSETSSYVGLGLFCFLIILALAFCGKSNDATEVKTATVDSTTKSESSSGYGDVAKQYGWISAGKEQIKGVLKDPDSADFKDVHFYSGGGIPVACGKVNAKNGFGGYTGFERFIAAGSVIAVTESMVEGGLGPVWGKYCIRSPSDAA